MRAFRGTLLKCDRGCRLAMVFAKLRTRGGETAILAPVVNSWRGTGLKIQYIALLCIVCVLALAGCGASSDAGSGNSTASSNQAPTVKPAPTTAPGSIMSLSCPTGAVVTEPTKANVTVSFSDQKTTTVIAHPGDIIEFRFPFGKKWSGPQSVTGVLAMQSPAGYASQADKACIWRFVARNVGTTVLDFNSQPICQRGQMCPMYIAVASFTVDVKS